MQISRDVILYVLLFFSGFLHVITISVMMFHWLRIRSGIVDFVTFNLFRDKTDERLDQCVTRSDLKDSIQTVDSRLNGLHASFKADQRTTQEIFREVLKALSKIEGQLSTPEASTS